MNTRRGNIKVGNKKGADSRDVNHRGGDSRDGNSRG